MFSLLLRTFAVIPALIGVTAFFPVSLRALSSDCIAVNSAMKEALSQGLLQQGQRIALQVLANDVSHLESVCAGVVLSNAAVLYESSGRFDEAQRFAEQSIEYLQRSLPEDDLVYLRPLHLLAALYLAQGLTHKASETLRKMERIRVTRPQDRALLLEINAAVLEREGKRDQAEKTYIAALEAISETGQQDSAYAAAVHRSIAYLYVEERRYDEASKAVDAAFATLGRAKDAVPLDRIQMLDVRATKFAYQGRWREAETDLREALSLARAQPHLSSIELQQLVSNYAQVLRKLHRKQARSVEAWAATLHHETGPSRQTVDVTEFSAVSK